MGKPQVTLTLAGDSSKLEKTFGAVGQSSKKMSDEVGASSRKVAEEAGSGFDRAGEAADTFDTRSMGARDGITGIQDSMTGFSALSQGDYVNGLLNLGSGFSDIGSSLYNFVIPSLKSLTKSTITNAIQMARQTVVTGAQKVAMMAGAVATNAMAVGQRVLNAAMRANPIGLIITALILLVGGLIYAYKKSETFRNIVNGAFHGVQAAVSFVIDWIRRNWPLLLAILTGPVGLAVLVIGKHKDKILGFFRSIPGAIGGFFRGIGSAIAAPFQSAFQAIKNAWNNTVGGKGFSVPGWIPGIGGKDFHIPYFHTGGVVSGALGSETLAVLKAGERVTGGSNSGGGGGVVTFRADGQWAKEQLRMMKETIRIEGGLSVVFAL